MRWGTNEPASHAGGRCRRACVVSDRSRPTDDLASDMRQRWQRGNCAPVERYLQEQPTLQRDAEAILNLIFAEVALREGRGETPQAQEYQARFPHLGEAIAAQFAPDGPLR